MLRNNAKKDKPPLEDEELLDIGELVLAAESNALKKQCLALKKERKRKGEREKERKSERQGIEKKRELRERRTGKESESVVKPEHK